MRWLDGGGLAIRVRSMVDRFRTSLFGVPVLWMVATIVLSRLVIELDSSVEPSSLPPLIVTTVDSARAILSAIASGTITAASVVFSLTLVAIQLSSSAYSSRVLRIFLRDPFQQNMIGLVLSAFVFSVLVLREVRGPVEEGGAPYLPSIAVAFAIVFALGALLALLASINHTAQQLRVSTVTRELTHQVLATIRERYRDPAVDADDDADGAAPGDTRPAVLAEMPSVPASHGTLVTVNRSGWVQQISLQALLEVIEPHDALRIEVAVGMYVFAGTPLVTVWTTDPDALVSLDRRVREAFGIGDQRTLQQDVGFGLVMLEDIALKALSPGINDPNTAHAVVAHLGEVVLEILSRKLPARFVAINDRRLFIPHRTTYDDVVHQAFDQVRTCARPLPTVLKAMLLALQVVRSELIRRGLATDAALSALRDQAAAVVAEIGLSQAAEVDKARALDVLDVAAWQLDGL